MNYRNSEMKIDQLVSYLNEGKINLSPPFQRGHVWRPNTRRKLIQNMIDGKPIPAVFLYKQESGTRYLYNILDGKQRIESLILFIASGKGNLSIKKWQDYFFNPSLRKTANFSVRITDKEKKFTDLDEVILRNFAEYVIPTIEITLEDNTSLDQVISLFVDINQQGVAVSRFQIVRAIRSRDPLLKSTLELIAIKERRREDEYYKMKNNDITFVMKKLTILREESDARTRIERMWQRLIEIALFVKTRLHRKPSSILRGMILGKIEEVLTPIDIRAVRRIFKKVRALYKSTSLGESKFAEDATYFYDMITYLVSRIDTPININQDALCQLAALLALKKEKLPSVHVDKITEYSQLVSKQTTEPSRRKNRQLLFADLVDAIAKGVKK